MAKGTETHSTRAVMGEQRNVLERVSLALGSAAGDEGEVPDEESSSVAPKAPESQRLPCEEHPLLTVSLVVLIIVIVHFYYRKPTDYFQPWGSEDIGGDWCKVSYEKIDCPQCTIHSKVYLIEEKIKSPALIVDALYKWQYSEYHFWNFHMKLQGLPNRSRLYFGLLTFDRRYVDVIALKFLLETNSNGNALFSHFELPRNNEKPTKNESGLLEYVKTSASEMRALLSEDWSYLQTIDTSFHFRIERGPHGGFLRHKSCDGDKCDEKEFEGSSRLETHFQPLEKKQVFFLSGDKSIENGEVELQKRCYIVDARHVQYCTDDEGSSLNRCKRATQGYIANLRKWVPWLSDSDSSESSE